MRISFQAGTEYRPFRYAVALMLSALVLAIQTACATLPPVPVRIDAATFVRPDPRRPLTVQTITRIEPLPQTIHVARIDLHHPRLEIVAMPAEAPPGAGDGDAVLTPPHAIASRHAALVAVNANGFGHVAAPDGATPSRFLPGQPVHVIGTLVSNGRVIGEAADHRGNDLVFWIDTSGNPGIGPHPGTDTPLREAINGWWIDLVADGRVLPRPNGDRHPRTALGLCADNRWLTLVVVDGRRERVSAGMTAHELALLMRELDCHVAINLDGGGSSIMLAWDTETETLRTVNRPSGVLARPLPVMLGVRWREPDRDISP